MPFNIVRIPAVEHLDAVDVGFWHAFDNWAAGAAYSLVAEGSVFDVGEKLGAGMFDVGAEGVEEVIEVEDAELVAEFDQGPKRGGLSCLAITDGD